MLTGVSEENSPSIVQLRYNNYLQIPQMYRMHNNVINQANIEMFLLKIDDNQIHPYSKHNLAHKEWFRIENPDIKIFTQANYNEYENSIFSTNFFKIILSGDEVKEDTRPKTPTEDLVNTFILVVGDSTICEDCVETIKSMEKIVGMFSEFETYQKALKTQKVRFLVADIMNFELDNMIPGDLPLLLSISHEVGNQANAMPGGYYYNSNRFGRMLQSVLNKPRTRIEAVPEFLNLLSIQLTA